MPEIPKRVEKPWGHELWWARTDRYVGKILHIKAGHALSVQYHRQKDETVYLLSGVMKYWVQPEARSPKPEASGTPGHDTRAWSQRTAGTGETPAAARQVLRSTRRPRPQRSSGNDRRSSTRQ